MVQLLVLIIFGVTALVLAYFLFREIPLFKKMAIVGGGFLAALVGVVLQPSQPLYLALLGILAVVIFVTLIYTKRQEKIQQQYAELAEQNRTNRTQGNGPSNNAIMPEPPVTETNEPSPKITGMESIDPNRKEQ